MCSLSDAQLMERVADGDPRAFDAVYRRHRSQALAAATRVAGSAGLAEEVMQDAFVNLWHSARAYDPSRGTLVAWLLTLVRFRGIDSLRVGARHSRNVPMDEIAARLEAPERPDEQVAEEEQSRHVRLMVGHLPAEQREAVALAYFEGLSQSEIAARSGIPLGTVKGRLRLALAKMSGPAERDSMLAQAS